MALTVNGSESWAVIKGQSNQSDIKFIVAQRDGPVFTGKITLRWQGGN